MCLKVGIDIGMGSRFGKRADLRLRSGFGGGPGKERGQSDTGDGEFFSGEGIRLQSGVYGQGYKGKKYDKWYEPAHRDTEPG